MNGLSNILINLDRGSRYIPVVSTITNLVDLFLKSVFLPYTGQSKSTNPYYSYITSKSTLRCIVLLLPIVGNILVGLFNIGKQTTTTLPPVPHGELLPSIARSLKEAVISKSQRSLHSTNTMVNFHTIFEQQGAKLVLGDDSVRKALMKTNSKTMDTMKAELKTNRLTDCDQALGEVYKESDLQIDNIKQVDVVLSFNGQVNGNEISPHPMLTCTELSHHHYPISEVKNAYEPALETNKVKMLFAAIDQGLNANKTVLLHCNSGQHRSGTMTVLYIASRTGCTFDEAHQFVANQRDISPLTTEDGHANLMTTARSMYSSKEARNALL